MSQDPILVGNPVDLSSPQAPQTLKPTPHTPFPETVANPQPVLFDWGFAGFGRPDPILKVRFGVEGLGFRDLGFRDLRRTPELCDWCCRGARHRRELSQDPYQDAAGQKWTVQKGWVLCVTLPGDSSFKRRILVCVLPEEIGAY